MKLMSLLIVFIFVFVAVGQEVQHAPTVAQCQADQRLWLSKLEDGDKSSALPEFDVLTKWT